jgi:acyl-coenzyme A thioesterase PaaI-like protein
MTSSCSPGCRATAIPSTFDPDLAVRSRFGGIIVQGGVTSALLNALVAEALPGPGSVFLHTSWSFRAPVRPGDVITAEAEVVEVRTDKPISILRTTIRNDAGIVVLDGTAIVWRDPAVAAAVGESSWPAAGRDPNPATEPFRTNPQHEESPT